MVKKVESSATNREAKKMDARVSALEQTVMSLAQSINGVLMVLDEKLSHVQAVLDATTEHIGQDVIQDRLNIKAEAEKVRVAEAAKVRLAELLSNGKVATKEVIGTDSVVVGKEVDSEGTVLPPAYVQFPMNRAPEFVQSLLGQAVGAKVPTPDGTFIEVTEIYELTTAPVAQVAG